MCRRKTFEQRVKETIRSIPAGKVATYGQVASLAGNYRGARQVARVLHTSSEKEHLPWQRVINSQGMISLGRGAGFEEQKRSLRAEGVRVNRRGRIDLSVHLWEPAESPGRGAVAFIRNLEKAVPSRKKKNST